MSWNGIWKPFPTRLSVLISRSLKQTNWSFAPSIRRSRRRWNIRFRSEGNRWWLYWISSVSGAKRIDWQSDNLEFVEKTNLEDHKSTHVKKTVKSGITFGSALTMVMIAIQLIHAAAVNYISQRCRLSAALSQFSKIVPIETAYLRYAVCGCCLCIQNANCYNFLTCDKICDKRLLEGI